MKPDFACSSKHLRIMREAELAAPHVCLTACAKLSLLSIQRERDFHARSLESGLIQA